MLHYDFLRELIFSSPSKICEQSTIYTYLMEELSRNYRFQAFVVVSILIGCLLIFFIYKNTGENSSWALVYLLGIQIFMIALMFKISKIGFGSKISGLDRKIYSMLKDMGESNTSLLPAVVLGALTRMHTSSGAPECETEKQVPHSMRQQLVESSMIIDGRSDLTESRGKPAQVVLVEKDEDRPREASGSASKDDAVLLRKNVLLVKANPRPASRRRAHVQVDAETDSGGEPASKKTAGHTESTTSTNQNEKGAPRRDRKSQIPSTEEAPATEPSPDLAADTQYFNSIIGTFSKEFESNDRLAANFKEISKMIKNTEHEIPKLDSELRKLIKYSYKIEKELKAFNVSVKGLEKIRSTIEDSLQKITPVKHIIENLNYKDSSDKDLSQILKMGQKDAPHGSSGSVKPDTSLITAFQIFLALQLIACIVFLSMTLAGSTTYGIRLFSAFLLCVGAGFGILILVLAHFYSRDCVLGRIEKCGEMFNKSFAELAKYADFDLKTKGAGKIQSFGNRLDKIEKRTGQNVATLKEILSDNAFGEFRLQSAQLRDTLEKLHFVKDSFEELTYGKVSRQQYYATVNEVGNLNAQIAQNLSFISQTTLFEFYTKELVFSTFIRNEKERILSNSGRQLVDPALRKSGRKAECDRLWKDICDKKVRLDQLFLLLLVSSFVFLIGFAAL